VLEDHPCLVLQYANDTLIVSYPRRVQQAKKLKEILDDFASTSGLKINFTKSTGVAINLTLHEGEEIDAVLNCEVASFPVLFGVIIL
jgi:hypothetical protein